MHPHDVGTRPVFGPQSVIVRVSRVDFIPHLPVHVKLSVALALKISLVIVRSIDCAVANEQSRECIVNDGALGAAGVTLPQCGAIQLVHERVGNGLYQNVAPVEVSVLKLDAVLGHGNGVGTLVHYGECLLLSGNVKFFQIDTAILQKEHTI